MKKYIFIIGFIILIPSVFAQHHAQNSSSKNHFGVGLSYAIPFEEESIFEAVPSAIQPKHLHTDEGAFMLHAHYVRQLRHRIGVGIEGQYTLDEHNQIGVGAVIEWNPVGHLILRTVPGVMKHHSEVGFMSHTGLRYEFHAGKLMFGPMAEIGLGMENNVGLGLHVGFAF